VALDHQEGALEKILSSKTSLAQLTEQWNSGEFARQRVAQAKD